MPTLEHFVRESNAIEGISRDPTEDELRASQRALDLPEVSVKSLGEFQAIVAPDHPLREYEGMNVQVVDHIAPPGGPNILRVYQVILRRANSGADPWKTHIAFETLHPYMDGNGRTGRILWAWQMKTAGRNPFALTFLHRWYYDTLRNSG